MFKHLYLALLVGTAALLTTSAVAQPRLSESTVDTVIAAMTLEEKAALLVGSNQGVLAGGDPSEASYALPPTATIYENKMSVGGSTYGFPHLGIPNIVMADGPAGLRLSTTRPDKSGNFYCTAFPVGTALSSTWNTDLLYNIGEAMGEEAEAYGVDIILAPALNLHRNPLCGRNFEYYSEDPLVSGKMAASIVNGIQSRGVGTSIKHYAANSQETNRKDNDDIVSQRALRELYLKGFEITIRESQPWTVMSSYNRINGTYTQEDPALLLDILRDEWGFDGFVMTDWTARRNTAAQVRAGNDLMMPGHKSQIREIVEKVCSGELPEADVDACVRRILKIVLRTGTFRGRQATDAPDLQANKAVSRQAAAEAMVLLKNEGGVLPLKDVQQIDLYGNTSYRFIAGGTGSGQVNAAYVRSLKDGLKDAGFSLNGFLDRLYGSYLNLHDARYADFRASIVNPKPIAEELVLSRSDLFKRASGEGDVAIITIGRNAGEGVDRRIPADFDLAAEETELIRNVCDAYHVAGKKVVVILNISGVVETASWKAWPDAILLAWQLGQEGGDVVTEALTGAINPSGKLPMTFPLQYFDHPSSYNFPFDFNGPASFGSMMSVTGRVEPLVKDVDDTYYEEGIYVGYRYFSSFGKEVSFPFGFGLSYTFFAYSKPVVRKTTDGFQASVTVTNTGSVAGKETVQLYVSAPDGGLEKPVRELRAFAKTALLQPGQSQTLIMDVDAYTLASFNETASAWETAPGTYRFQFGSNVEEIRCTAEARVPKLLRWPVHNVMAPAKELQELTRR